MKKEKRPKNLGFIVHPWETFDGKSWDASYSPDNNGTMKKFKTLRDAKAYLRGKGIKKALYDAPQGTKELTLTQKAKVKKRMVKKRVSRTAGIGSAEWVKREVGL